MMGSQKNSDARNDIRMKNLCKKIALGIGLLAVVSTTTFADPAPWFYWKNIISNERVCTQFPPEDGWVKDGGPYKDARCENRFR